MKQINIKELMLAIGKRALKASEVLRVLPSNEIALALNAIADGVLGAQSSILKANRIDVAKAKAAGRESAMIDRLALSEHSIADLAGALRQVAALPTTIGTTTKPITRPNGLKIGKMVVPIGVVGIIYESRPNVTTDAAAICLRSHNAVILRGGSESLESNMALIAVIRKALKTTKVPLDAVQYIPTTDRAAVGELVTLDRYVDLIIPRGGESLIKTVTKMATIPVIKHYNGICHTYVAASAPLASTIQSVINAKVQKPSACNSIETLLLDKNLPLASQKAIVEALVEQGVVLVGDRAAQKLAKVISPATEEDWSTEYLALKLSVKIVNGVREAIDHINAYSSHHTDAILTKDKAEAEQFVESVDSASVMVNASPRFADGGEGHSQEVIRHLLRPSINFFADFLPGRHLQLASGCGANFDVGLGLGFRAAGP